MTKYRLVSVRSKDLLGTVTVDGKELRGDPMAVAVAASVLRRAGGLGEAALKDWTNGYVQLKGA